jgi:hypothetical protein
MKKELFVCDRCGKKSRLDSLKRHWCDLCALQEQTELRPVRIKRLASA